MSTLLEERPDVREEEDLSDEDSLAHLVNKAEWGRGYILGEPVRALCGKTWVPHRDPSGIPVCPKCLKILEIIRSFQKG